MYHFGYVYMARLSMGDMVHLHGTTDNASVCNNDLRLLSDHSYRHSLHRSQRHYLFGTRCTRGVRVVVFQSNNVIQ